MDVGPNFIFNFFNDESINKDFEESMKAYITASSPEDYIKFGKLFGKTMMNAYPYVIHYANEYRDDDDYFLYWWNNYKTWKSEI